MPTKLATAVKKINLVPNRKNSDKKILRIYEI
jgi:hypothetical protein